MFQKINIKRLLASLAIAVAIALPPVASALTYTEMLVQYGSYVPARGVNGPFCSGYTSTAIDTGIAGMVGPAGYGISNFHSSASVQVTNDIFVGWATGIVPGSYRSADGVDFAWGEPSKVIGPANGDWFDVLSLGDMNYTQLTEYHSTTYPELVRRGAVLLDANGVPIGADVSIDTSDLGMQPGTVTVTFAKPIGIGIGKDFAVFENSFVSGGGINAEFGYVEVSTDGKTFARFPSLYLNTSKNMGLSFSNNNIFQPAGIGYLNQNVSFVYNLAGKHCNAYGVSYGTPFDLADLADNALTFSEFLGDRFSTPAVDLDEIWYVRIVDIPGNGSFTDSLGNSIFDAWVTVGSGGFDLAAVGVINKASDIIVKPGKILTCEGRQCFYTIDEFTMEVVGATAKVVGTSYETGYYLPSVNYQWYKDGEPIEGATEATYTTKQDEENASYFCRVTASTPGCEDGLRNTAPIVIETLPPYSNRKSWSIYETVVTANTSTIKEMTVKITDVVKTAKTGKLATTTVPIHYRAPVSKKYTIVMGYYGTLDDTYTTLGYGLMVSKDKNEPRHLLEGEILNPRGADNEGFTSEIGAKGQNVPESGEYRIINENGEVLRTLKFAGLATRDMKTEGKLLNSTGAVYGEKFFPVSCDKTEACETAEQGYSDFAISQNDPGDGVRLDGIYYQQPCLATPANPPQPPQIKPAHFHGTYTTRLNKSASDKATRNPEDLQKIVDELASRAAKPPRKANNAWLLYYMLWLENQPNNK